LNLHDTNLGLFSSGRGKKDEVGQVDGGSRGSLAEVRCGRNLAFAPEEPFAAAPAVLRIEGLAAKSLAEGIRMNRIGEAEDAVGDVVAADGVPTRASDSSRQKS
jgi:hypothetical protein